MIRAATGLKWSAIEKIGTQSIQLIIIIILGRFLGPEAFGLIGMLSVFIAIAQTLIDSGFTNAMIRKSERSEDDYSTMFYINVLVSIFCYVLLYFSAPYIASFYQQHELIDLARVIGLTFIFNSFILVNKAKLIVLVDFKSQAKVSFLSVTLSSLVSLSMAIYGFGVWALVGQVVSFSIFNCIFMMAFFPWYPMKRFSLKSYQYLFGFGSKLLISGLIDTIYNNIYFILIGKYFSTQQLGYFNQAQNLTHIPSMSLASVIQRVTYPIMSDIDDDDRLSRSFALSIKLTALVVFPILAMLAVIAKPLVSIILGDEWISMGSLISILCVGYILYPLNALNLNVLQIKGRSDLFLKLEIIKKIIVTIIISITIFHGVEFVCIGIALQLYISFIINAYFSGKLIGFGVYKQIKILIPIWIFVLIVSLLLYFSMGYFNSDILVLIYCLFSFLILYFSYLWFVHRDMCSYFYLAVKS